MAMKLKRLKHVLTLHAARKRRRKNQALKRALRILESFPRNTGAPRHNLPGKLVVSLTSYPARFSTLHLTLQSICDQTVKPDLIVLWVDAEAAELLPPEVTNLANGLFQVRTCTDLRSFTKIIPALTEYSGAFIITADDDQYYEEDWLGRLVDAFDPADPTIVYHRGHRVRRSRNGGLAPYATWRRPVSDRKTSSPQIDIFPDGVGGVLYPPGSLTGKTSDLHQIKTLWPTCDDTWLYFMWRLNGWRAKRTSGKAPRLVEWPTSQSSGSLKLHHSEGVKDMYLKQMSDAFGCPLEQTGINKTSDYS